MTIAHIGQTPLQIHWSWPLMLLMLTGLLTPLYAALLPRPLVWAAALVTMLLIYASVLLHELAHAIAGYLRGLPVRSIMLFGFGGRTEIDEARLQPLDELLMALAGPCMSFVLTLIWWVSASMAHSEAERTLALALTIVNGSLLAFNLLPGYPLDGGRALKAALWFLLDEEVLAARSMRQIGRACGWGVIVLALIHLFIGGHLAATLALGVAGYGLIRAADHGFRRLTLQLALRGVTVADLMQRSLHTIPADLPIDQFVGQLTAGQPDQIFPVVQLDHSVDQPQLLGLISVRDLRRLPPSRWVELCVADVMTPIERILLLHPATLAADALRLVNESGIDFVPVVENNTLFGVVRRRDIVLYIRMRLAHM
jgi:Zn-dependent protease/CBS domain-containing protein